MLNYEALLHQVVFYFFLGWLEEFLGEEEPDASVPLQVSEDMVEDDISSRYSSNNKTKYSFFLGFNYWTMLL